MVIYDFRGKRFDIIEVDTKRGLETRKAIHFSSKRKGSDRWYTGDDELLIVYDINGKAWYLPLSEGVVIGSMFWLMSPDMERAANIIVDYYKENIKNNYIRKTNSKYKKMKEFYEEHNEET